MSDRTACPCVDDVDAYSVEGPTPGTQILVLYCVRCHSIDPLSVDAIGERNRARGYVS